MPRGVPQIEVTFEVDGGICTAKATELSSKSSTSITINSNKGRMTAKEIDAAIKASEANKEKDKLVRERLEIVQSLQARTDVIKNALRRLDSPVDSKVVAALKAVEEAIPNKKLT